MARSACRPFSLQRDLRHSQGVHFQGWLQAGCSQGLLPAICRSLSPSHSSDALLHRSASDPGRILRPALARPPSTQYVPEGVHDSLFFPIYSTTPSTVPFRCSRSQSRIPLNRGETEDQDLQSGRQLPLRTKIQWQSSPIAAIRPFRQLTDCGRPLERQGHNQG